jgi:hypothetical protein
MCAVIGMQSTGEANSDAARLQKGDTMDDLVSAPQMILLNFINNHFPVRVNPSVADLQPVLDRVQLQVCPDTVYSCRSAQIPGTAAGLPRYGSAAGLPRYRGSECHTQPTCIHLHCILSICTSSAHLHMLHMVHLHICTSAHLHICTSAHLRMHLGIAWRSVQC